ncbi:hypothetical protein IM543_00660 [Massilia sp. UMI-21]|nr:hypothetical protein IM543_00660 [Massilia sp. UMI-21]
MGGQALTEFIVLALVLIPLFLIIPLIAKYQDIAHHIQMASRYVAFEAMARNDSMSSWKPQSQLEQEVQRRFFSNSDAPIKSNDEAGDFNSHRNAFWKDPMGAPLIRNFNDDVRISFGPDNIAAIRESFINASDNAPFRGLVGVSDALGLNAPGIHRANVTVVLANISQPDGIHARAFEGFKNINLTMSRQTSLLIDPWSARDSAQIEERIDDIRIFPGSMLTTVAPLVDAAVAIVESPSCFKGGCTSGPKLGKLDFWRDVVPNDRLK